MSDMSDERREELCAWLIAPIESAVGLLGEAQEAARRWCASDGAGETPLPDFAEAAAAAREAQDAASAALEAMGALRDGA